VNGCGSGTAASLSLTRTLPSTPGTISTTTVTGTCPNKVYRYSISALPTNARSILWTVPTGATIDSGQGGLRIRVIFPAKGTAYSGSVTAAGVNACGTGTGRSTTVKITACAIAKSLPEYLDGWQLSVFPNPTSGQFNMNVLTENHAKLEYRLLDMQGRELHRNNLSSGVTETFGGNLLPGAYWLEIRQGKTRKTIKLVKQ